MARGGVAGQGIVVHLLPQQGRFEQHLHQFFDKERHPICLRDDLGQHLGREGFGARQLSHEGLDFGTR
jgi:hypothetical protein